MKRLLGIALLIAVSMTCVWFTFRGVDFSEVWNMFRSKGEFWHLFLFSGLCMWANILFRGLRFHRILANYPEVSLKESFNLTSIMFLGNSILPLRAGEAIRVYLPHRLYRIPLATSMAFHGADRVFDLVAMLALLALSLFFAGDTIAAEARHKPVDMFGAEYTFDGLIQTAQTSSLVLLAIGALGIGAICVIPEFIKKAVQTLFRIFGKRVVDILCGIVDHIHNGIAVFRKPKDFLLSILWTACLWYMVILNVQFLSSIFDVDLNWAQSGVVVVLVAVAVSLPQAPGYVGPFHLGCQMALSICFGVPMTAATAIAYATHFFQVIPVILLGFISMSIEGINLSSFAEARQSLESEKNAES